MAAPVIGLAAGTLVLMLAAGLGREDWFQGLRVFDQYVYRLLAGYHSPFMTEIALALDIIGSAKGELAVLLAAGSVLVLGFKRYEEAVVWTGAYAGAWWLNHALKELFSRSRPEWEHLADTNGYSFPSGHAMVSLVFYGMFAYLLWLHFKRMRKTALLWKWLPWLFITPLIILIGLSRIYLGVHYPSDVAAGFAAGFIWLYACIRPLRSVSEDKPPQIMKH